MALWLRSSIVITVVQVQSTSVPIPVPKTSACCRCGKKYIFQIYFGQLSLKTMSLSIIFFVFIQYYQKHIILL